MNCKVISIINNKGGVSKTTTVNICATLLAAIGKKVLIVDCDESGNLSMSYDHFVDDPLSVLDGIENPSEPNIAELYRYRMRSKDDVEKVIYHTYNNNIDIIPASKRHKHTPSYILQSTGNNNIILKRALQAVRENYDFILIDNAPADNILTVNSMFASDYVLVPIRIENYSYKGLKETLTSMNYIIEEHDLESLHFLGAFFTQVNPRTNIFREMTQKCSDDFSNAEIEGKFFHTFIRMDTKINEINVNFGSLLKHPESNALIDYAQLLLEMQILDPESEKILKDSII